MLAERTKCYNSPEPEDGANLNEDIEKADHSPSCEVKGKQVCGKKR